MVDDGRLLEIGRVSEDLGWVEAEEDGVTSVPIVGIIEFRVLTSGRLKDVDSPDVLSLKACDYTTADALFLLYDLRLLVVLCRVLGVFPLVADDFNLFTSDF